jgi:hypothetical protein
MNTNQERTMTPEERNQRREELARQLAYANALGVRAAVCNDAEQHAEAKRLYDEAMRELETLKSIGERIESWVCYGMPAEPLTQEERAAIVDYADSFEECDESSDELHRQTDYDLIHIAYRAMADYASGQM